MEGLAAAAGTELHYLYGFLRSSTALPALEGVEPGAMVSAVICGDLACAVSLVPADAYRQPGHARDERWLAPRALRHHDVLSALHRVTTVLPLRFGSLCGTEDDVRAILAERHGALLNLLATFDGRDEWTLRMAADTAAIVDRCERESPELQALREREAGIPEGRAYFLRKHRASRAATLVSDTMAAIEDAVLERLARLALPIVRGRRLTPRAFADAAVLVGRGALPALKEALVDLEGEQAWCELRFALVGPWPAYSFAPAVGGN
jgi:Gas vesicle synthesis protein GvpL/GvpF